MTSRRIIYFILFIFCTWLALFTRKEPQFFHPIIVEYGGDTLWASGFYFLMRSIFIRTSPLKLAIIVYALGVLDELSQLWRAPFLNEIRSTYIGKLMLGQGFLWSDLVCYGVGTLLAFAIVLIVERIRPVN